MLNCYRGPTKIASTVVETGKIIALYHKWLRYESTLSQYTKVLEMCSFAHSYWLCY